MLRMANVALITSVLTLIVSVRGSTEGQNTTLLPPTTRGPTPTRRRPTESSNATSSSTTISTTTSLRTTNGSTPNASTPLPSPTPTDKGRFVIIVASASGGGGLIVIILVISCCCCCYCRRKRKFEIEGATRRSPSERKAKTLPRTEGVGGEDAEYTYVAQKPAWSFFFSRKKKTPRDGEIPLPPLPDDACKISKSKGKEGSPCYVDEKGKKSNLPPEKRARTNKEEHRYLELVGGAECQIENYESVEATRSKNGPGYVNVQNENPIEDDGYANADEWLGAAAAAAASSEKRLEEDKVYQNANLEEDNDYQNLNVANLEEDDAYQNMNVTEEDDVYENA